MYFIQQRVDSKIWQVIHCELMLNIDVGVDFKELESNYDENSVFVHKCRRSTAHNSTAEVIMF